MKICSKPRSLVIRLFSVLALPLLVAGCSSSAKEINPDPETKEIVAQKDVDIDSPEGILFESAKTSFQNQLYSVAKDQFTALMSNFPHGPLAEYAELKVADCSFFIRDYDVCAPLYEEYAKNHPGTLSAAYSLLMAARSYHLSSKGVGHDAHALERAQETYGKLLEQYPDSVYAKQAAAYQRSAINDLTANERAVAEFYKKRGQEDAYRSRMKAIEEKWRPLAHNVQKTFDAHQDQGEQGKEIVVASVVDSADSDPEEAEEGVEESKEEPVEEAEETAKGEEEEDVEAVEEDLQIAEPFEGSEGENTDVEESNTDESDRDSSDEEDTETPDEYKDAVPIPEPIVDEPVETPEEVEQEEEEAAEESSVDGGEILEEELDSEEIEDSASDEGQIRKVPPVHGVESTPEMSSTTGEIKLAAPIPRLEIIQVGCAGGEVVLYLNQPWSDRGFLVRNRKLIPHDGIVSVTLPLTRGTGKTYDCFGTGDLLVDSNGTITVAYDQPMFVQTLNEPPQITFSGTNSK